MNKVQGKLLNKLLKPFGVKVEHGEANISNKAKYVSKYNKGCE